MLKLGQRHRLVENSVSWFQTCMSRFIVLSLTYELPSRAEPDRCNFTHIFAEIARLSKYSLKHENTIFLIFLLFVSLTLYHPYNNKKIIQARPNFLIFVLSETCRLGSEISIL